MDHRFVGVPELSAVPRVAVVVDVMRAFTVAAWAFARGAEKIVLAGRTVVQKTTAGTVGALAVASAPLVLCASFAVAGATARFLKNDGSGPVTFIITGDDGQAAEDLACAAYIGRRLTGCDVEAARQENSLTVLRPITTHEETRS